MSANRAGYRRFKNRLAMGVMFIMVLLCLTPLVSVSIALLARGIPAINWFLLTSPTGGELVGAEMKIGGIGNAIVGTLILLALATVVAAPCGLLIGMYLSLKSWSPWARLTRLLLDVMSGVPAIIVGVFIYTVVVSGVGFSLHMGSSALAGGLALAMIMLPIFSRATEESLRAIPDTYKEAGLALGLPRRRVILRIILRAATPAVLTGLFLSLSRVGGEAAPLLFTTSQDRGWPAHSWNALVHLEPLRQPVSSLPWVLYDYTSSQADAEHNSQAWGAGLILVVGILVVRISTRMYTRWKYGEGGVA